MGCDEIRGAVAIGDGLCLMAEGPYEGYTVSGEESEGTRVGDIVAGPGGETSASFVGVDLTNCSSGMGGVVMPLSVSSAEVESLAEAYPGRVALSNAEGTDAAGEACLAADARTRLHRPSVGFLGAHPDVLLPQPVSRERRGALRNLGDDPL